MKRVVVVIVLLFGGALNAQAAGWYVPVKWPGGDNFDATTAYCNQTYGAQKYASQAGAFIRNE